MMASARATPRITSSAIPATQNTAPVLEFRCLYTHDLRQKKKRWQDGYLKFHTFNKRVMIYDTSRNYVADTYWKDANELQEGDELATERVLIQVEEAIGTTQTDLDSVLKKKSPQSKPVPRPLARPTAPLGVITRPGAPVKHKSLNALLGTPKGPIGKSVPITSPYDQRQEKENEWAHQRAAKRQKTDHTPVMVRSSSPLRREGPPAGKTLPSWGRISDAKRAPAPPKPAAKESSTVVLDSTSDRTSTDADLLSSPYKAYNRIPPAVITTNAAPVPDPRKQAPIRTVPKPPARKVQLPRSKVNESACPPPMTSSPPVSVSNHMSKTIAPIEPVALLSREPTPPKSPPRDPRARSLKLVSGPRRGMLLCQSLPPPLRSIKPAASRPAQERKPKKKLKENIDPVVEADDFVTEADDFGSIPIFSDDEVSRVENVPVYCEPEADTLGKRKAATVPDQPTSLSRRPELGEKLTAKPVSKQPKAIYSMPSSSLDEDRSVGEESPPRRPSGPIISKKRKSAPRPLSKISTKKTKTSERLLSSSPPAFDDISTVQGGMGQQLIPRQSPQHKTIAKTKSPPIIKAVMPKPAPKKKVQERAPLGQESPAPILTTKGLKTRKKKSIEQNPPIEEPAPSASPAGKPGKPKKVTKTTVRKAAATAVSITSTHSASPMVPSPRYITIPDSPLSERSPSLSPSLQTPSLPASRSVSPHKVPFSAGGFRRKKNKKTATPVPETDIPNPVRRAPVLPPPFATNKRMGEKGLGELERPLKSARLEDDPIEDEDQPIEPVRNTRNANRFRRIRSTSDMLDEPIPSASKEWEYNNLSRATLELENTAIVSGPAPAPAVGNKLKATNGLAALVKKTDPRKKFQRAQSLNVATSFKRAPTPDIPSPPPDTDVGPWSTEAFDLLGWRPPNREDDMDMDEDADAW